MKEWFPKKTMVIHHCNYMMTWFSGHLLSSKIYLDFKITKLVAKFFFVLWLSNIRVLKVKESLGHLRKSLSLNTFLLFSNGILDVLSYGPLSWVSLSYGFFHNSA